MRGRGLFCGSRLKELLPERGPGPRGLSFRRIMTGPILRPSGGLVRLRRVCVLIRSAVGNWGSMRARQGKPCRHGSSFAAW